LKGWQAGQSNRVVQAGEGFFLKEAEGVTTITTVQPYTWPQTTNLKKKQTGDKK